MLYLFISPANAQYSSNNTNSNYQSPESFNDSSGMNNSSHSYNSNSSMANNSTKPHPFANFFNLFHRHNTTNYNIYPGNGGLPTRIMSTGNSNAMVFPVTVVCLPALCQRATVMLWFSPVTAACLPALCKLVAVML